VSLNTIKRKAFTISTAKFKNSVTNNFDCIFVYNIAHLRKECHNSKFRIFELLVQKETFADVLLTGIVS